MPEAPGDRDTGPVLLRTAIGRYPHTVALRDGKISSKLLRFDFADMPTINRAFAPMVREQRFDVSEMAIATFLQAKAYGKPLVLLPVVLSARFQEPALLCRSDSDIGGPHDLVGRRVGVRAYSQTTGVWLRGILADAHGVRPRDIHWITFEDAHVAEYRDPTWVERAPTGTDLVGMLRQGELDAVIVGNELPNDASLRTVFPDPEACRRRILASAWLRADQSPTDGARRARPSPAGRRRRTRAPVPQGEGHGTLTAPWPGRLWLGTCRSCPGDQPCPALRARTGLVAAPVAPCRCLAGAERGRGDAGLSQAIANMCRSR